MKPIPILRHVPHEPAGTLETSLAEAGLPLKYIDLFAHVPRKLDLDLVPALVVMGGPMNVDDTVEYPFLAAEIDWLQEAVERNLPIMGICLGAQLLAKALGAKVYPNPTKEIGWHDVELLPGAAGDALLAGCYQASAAAAAAAPQRAARLGAPHRHAPHVTVFQWHGDTFDLPGGAVHLAASPICRQQAFRHGQHAYGLQFHIEMTSAMIDDWLDVPQNRRELEAASYVNPEVIRAQTPSRLPGLQVLARDVLGRFAAICRRHVSR